MCAPLGVQILSISCSFWENLANLYVGTPPGELVPPPQGNPGSTTDNVDPNTKSLNYMKILLKASK